MPYPYTHYMERNRGDWRGGKDKGQDGKKNRRQGKKGE